MTLAAAPGVWRLALWLGLAVAVVDDLFVLAHRFLLDEITRVGGHVYWMSAVSNLTLFLLAAGVVFGMGRIWGPLRTIGFRVGVFAALGAFGQIQMFREVQDLAALILALGIGAIAGRSAERWPDRSARLVRRTSLPLALAFVGVAISTFAVSAVRRSRALEVLPAPASGTGPNIILIVLDTVRAKSLGLYGHVVETSRNLERFARSGVTFERAISTSPWTLPSHASMFTGRYPNELGVNFFVPLDDTYPTIAEVLAGEGYETAGFVGNLLYASRVFGVDRGFVRYEDYVVSPGEILLSSALGRRLATSTRLRTWLGRHQLVNRKSAAEISRSFLAWFDGREAVRPYFAFLNYYDAHEPYLPGAPYDRLSGSRPAKRSLWHYGSLRLGNEARRPNRWVVAPGDPRQDIQSYEGAVAELDAALGDLFDQLESRGAYENTIVIVTADHGEMLGEQNTFYHWTELYLPVLHVPLVIRHDGRLPADSLVYSPVSLVDLPATILELAGIEERGGIPGRSLLAPPDVAEPPGDLFGFAFSWLAGAPTISLVSERFHYILEPLGAREELYDLIVDPDERHNLVESAAALPTLRFLRNLAVAQIER